MRKSIQGIYDTEWDGIDIRVLRLLGENLGFAAEFRDPASSMPSETESIINDISEDEAPVAVGGVYQTSDLLAHFDTPFSYLSDCASFISLSSTALPKYRAVLRPFQDTVWILLCVVYIIAIIPFTLNSDYTFLSLIKHPSGLNHMFWFVFCTFTNAFDMKNPLLTRGLGKHPTSILIGSLIAFITIPDYPPAIESAQQLLKKHYRISTLDHDGWEKWFTSENMEDQIAKNLLKSVELVPSVSEGVKNASRAFFWPYAFLGSRTALEYSVQTELSPNWKSKRSLMHISDECFVRFGVTIVLKSQSFYTEPFNKVILRAKQSGLIRKIQRDIEWDVQRSSTGRFLQVIKGYTSSLPIEERELVLDDTQGMFLVLSSGFLIAILSLLSEYFCHLIMTDCGKKLKVEIIQDFDEKKDWSPNLTDDMIMSIRSITARKSI
ncbi:ionotropic receptor 21a isoform X2 [Leptopilina heterotoma]|uniref:ionotropic receptor 21a isoform X2 n=1 Tax=Leptopilina heterotoma TaxID=63436 RepID=UPI001CA80B5F|nr:ionotropic receptor 21a isoform X2 [Leptopilina heterotoma]